jgi:hypothetical protein
MIFDMLPRLRNVPLGVWLFLAAMELLNLVRACQLYEAFQILLSSIGLTLFVRLSIWRWCVGPMPTPLPGESAGADREVALARNKFYMGPPSSN